MSDEQQPTRYEYVPLIFNNSRLGRAIDTTFDVILLAVELIVLGSFVLGSVLGWWVILRLFV